MSASLDRSRSSWTVCCSRSCLRLACRGLAWRCLVWRVLPRALADSTWRRSVGAARAAAPDRRPPARPTLVAAALLWLRAVRADRPAHRRPGWRASRQGRGRAG
jgi:hypothetical protein